MSSETHGFEVAIDRSSPEVIVLSVSGDVDPVTAPELGAHLDECVAAGHPVVVVDLGGVAFIDSSGLRVLVTAHQALGDGRRLELRNLRSAVQRVVDLSGLAEVFDVR
jgi:anti-anti-sigma factor